MKTTVRRHYCRWALPKCIGAHRSIGVEEMALTSEPLDAYRWAFDSARDDVGIEALMPHELRAAFDVDRYVSSGASSTNVNWSRPACAIGSVCMTLSASARSGVLTTR